MTPGPVFGRQVPRRLRGDERQPIASHNAASNRPGYAGSSKRTTIALAKIVDPSLGSKVAFWLLLKDRLSDIEELADAIRRVARGGSAIDPSLVAQLLRRQRARNPLDELTDREREVLGLMADGRSNQAIAQRLVVTLKTIETDVAGIFSKLDLEPEPDDHRRVLAVLTYLRAR